LAVLMPPFVASSFSCSPKYVFSKRSAIVLEVTSVNL